MIIPPALDSCVPALIQINVSDGNSKGYLATHIIYIITELCKVTANCLKETLVLTHFDT